MSERKIISPEQFNRKAHIIATRERGDIEVMHSDWDDLMLDTLEALGYPVDVIRETPKWFA